MLSFKEYVLMTEATQSRRYWFHVKTKKLVKVTERWHDWAPIGRPEAFGLKASQVEKFKPAMDRREDIIHGVAALMTRQGYIRVSASFNEWDIRAGTLAQAAAAGTAMAKKHKIPPRLFLDAGSTSKMLVRSEIEDFIKTGKIVKRTEIGRTMARFR